jgi:hypothetical protein
VGERERKIEGNCLSFTPLTCKHAKTPKTIRFQENRWNDTVSVTVVFLIIQTEEERED